MILSGKANKTSTLSKNHRKRRKAKNGNGGLPQGRADQIISPENMQRCSLIWVEQDIFQNVQKI